MRVGWEGHLAIAPPEASGVFVLLLGANENTDFTGQEWVLNKNMVFHTLETTMCWATMKYHNGLCFCNLVGDMTDATYAYNAGASDNHTKNQLEQDLPWGTGKAGRGEGGCEVEKLLRDEE